MLVNNLEQHFTQTRRSHDRNLEKVCLPTNLLFCFWENYLNCMKLNRMRNIHSYTTVCSYINEDHNYSQQIGYPVTTTRDKGTKRKSRVDITLNVIQTSINIPECTTAEVIWLVTIDDKQIGVLSNYMLHGWSSTKVQVWKELQL